MNPTEIIILAVVVVLMFLVLMSWMRAARAADDSAERCVACNKPLDPFKPALQASRGRWRHLHCP